MSIDLKSEWQIISLKSGRRLKDSTPLPMCFANHFLFYLNLNPPPPRLPRHFCLLRQWAPEAIFLAWLLIITVRYPESFFSVTRLNHLSVKWMGPWEYDTSWKNSRQQQKEFEMIAMWLRLSMKRWIRYWAVLSFLILLILVI